ncbi:uncharacterized protein [Chelonus insularis]|uniref:uncharacterized protein n=1 Tax=Chelonus insularis TaxID=460826 RepID=UPI00158E40AB|nr:uncharacterized protein LOC118066126 [Chelonus insularis]
MSHLERKIYSNPLKWKLRTFFYLFFFIVTLYTIVIRKSTYQIVVENTIKNSTPEQVWEYVIDFSNMMKLNPTIEEFRIINESGPPNNWKYSVHYKEHLYYIPFIKNEATAEYSTKHGEKDYFIISNHVTCFLKGFFCVGSDSEFKFSRNNSGTTCTEQVKYECPMLFYFLCRGEVLYQRHEIMKRLTQTFSH